ncbi:MAG: replicative DNA helicase [Kiritimatiellia bacterium]
MDHRPYPHSLEAERALLGGLLEDPDQVLPIADSLRQDDFYRPDHGELFRLLVEMCGRGEQVDLLTLPQRILREGREERYGGVSYVVELPDYTPSTANLGHYADVVKQQSMLRRLISTSEGIARKAFGSTEDVGILVETAMRDLATLGQDGAGKSWGQISIIIDEEMANISNMADNDDEVVGVSTGFAKVDAKLAGMREGQLIILAARPGMGKTALALNMAQNASLIGKTAVAIYSLEMTRHELINRFLTSRAEVHASRMRTGNLDQDEWARLIDASEELRGTLVFIDDTPALSIGEVRARARKLKAKVPELGFIVIDYLQLMRGNDAKAPRVQQVGEISRGLKAMAKDLKLPVMALSQLNRGVEGRQDKRPMLSDLRESGAIEQDADVIMFIYRDDYYDPESADKGLAELIIAKQRAGSTGTVKLVFQGQYTRFDTYDDAGPLV